MAVTPKLDLRQSQALVMTPHLQQAIKLLQLSNIELAVYVDQELEKNPLLERDDEPRNTVDDAPEDPAVDSPEGGEQETAGLEDMDFTARPAAGESGGGAMDVDYDNVWNNDNQSDSPVPDSAPGLRDQAFSAGGIRGGGFDNALSSLEETLPEAVTLRDLLNRQLALDIEDPADRLIGTHLIDMLDEAGYVSGNLAQVAAVLGCGEDRVEATLLRLQHFDPPGIFARGLAECLALQLRDRNRLDPAMQALLDNLDLLAKKDFTALDSITGVDREDLADMVNEIKALDPKPALAFDQSPTQTVIPDVYIRPNPTGGWIIELNTDTLPRVLINNQYYAEISSAARSKEDKHYISECFRTASWLVKSLHQRANTILKVATEIVRQQELFFLHGVQYLRPLVLRDISEVIEMHESTVSRVTSNKYMATPRGIFELKYFFTTAIGSSAGGAAYSSESVRHRIRELVDAEAADDVLSDDSIVETLQAEGIDIARRTVAKYRNNMGIFSSVQRRREKMSRM